MAHALACGGDDATADEVSLDGSGGGGMETEGDGATDGEETALPDPEQGTPAQGIQIAHVEANQGTAIDLTDASGSWLAAGSRSGPLLTERPTLIRVHWALDADFSPRPIVARLALYEGETLVDVLEESREINGPPQPLTLAGAFSFQVPAESVGPDTEFSLALFEDDGSESNSGSTGPRLPASGHAPLEFDDTPRRMKIVLVPIEVGGVGPDMDKAAERVHEEVYQANPLQSLEVEVAAARSWPQPLGAVGEAIELVAEARSEGNAAPGDYYLGVMGDGCCAPGVGGGMGFVASDEMEDGPNRISIAKIPAGNDPVVIFAHEIGHNQGLDHAPCSAPSPHIPGYPHPDCRIAAQGYGVLDGALRLEEYTFDYMSYEIGNQWTSDYVYGLNAARIATVTSWEGSSFSRDAAASGHTLHGIRRTDGSVGWWVTEGLTSTARGKNGGMIGHARVQGVGGERTLPIYASRVSHVDVGLFELPWPEGLDDGELEVSLDDATVQTHLSLQWDADDRLHAVAEPRR
ncbi:MAG: hypothetical protein AAF799_27610 [Myxococcota bacterium]